MEQNQENQTSQLTQPVSDSTSEPNWKLKIFSEQVKLIEDKDVYNLTCELISNLPDGFFMKGASSSGKYHPEECRGTAGLVTHTKYAFNTVLMFLDIHGLEYSTQYKSIMLSAILLHDGAKYGLDGTLEHTTGDHPQIMADFIAEKAREYPVSDVKSYILNEISSLIRTHHGNWGPIKPDSKAAWIIHYADMVASRLHKIRTI